MTITFIYLSGKIRVCRPSDEIMKDNKGKPSRLVLNAKIDDMMNDYVLNGEKPFKAVVSF